MAVIKIAVSKGGDDLEVDTEKLPTEVYEACFIAGVKEYLNKRMTKVTKKDMPNEEERKAQAMSIAAENLKNMYAGNIPVGRKRASGKIPARVRAEALRISKRMIKDAMKAEKIKVSYVNPKEITAAANELLDNDPDILKLAQENIAAADAAATKTVEKGTSIKAIAARIKINPDKKAKAEKAAADKKAEKQLSAKQAGMVQVRAKGKPSLHA